MHTPPPDIANLVLGTAVAAGTGATYDVVATTPASASPLFHPSAFFSVVLAALGAATALRFRVQGSMDGTDWEDVLAAFSGATTGEADVYRLVLNVADAALLADGAAFRIRVDGERYNYLRLLALNDGAATITTSYRRG